ARPTPQRPSWLDDLPRLLFVAVQFAMVAVVVRAFELENRSAYELLLLAIFGFLIHTLLPLRFRLPFFAALSCSALPFVLGMRAGIAVLGIGCLLIAVCHLPIRVWARTLILVGVGIGLLLLRSRVSPPFFSIGGWSILGSMFMFRLVLYFHS